MFKLIKFSLIGFCFLLPSCGSDRDESKMIFRYNEAEGISSLDPLYAHNRANIWAINMLYNGLFELDSLLKPIPCLAKKFELSEDKRTYIFTLQKGILFHPHPCFADEKERELKASDVEFSLRRLKKFPASGWVLSEVEENENEAAIKALNDSVVEIRLKEPFVQFINVLTMPYCAIVSEKAVSYYKENFRNHPVGTGPFQWKVWNENEKLVLLKNQDYFQFDGPYRLPYLDAVNITFIKDRQIEFLDFIMGKIDFMSGVEPAFKDEILTIKGDLNPKYSKDIQLLKQPYLNTEYLGVLVDGNDEWSHAEFRKLIHQSINKKAIISYVRTGIGIPAEKGFVPPVLFSTPPNQLSEINIESKKNSKPYPNPNLKLYTSGNYTDIALAIRNDLKIAGFQCSIEVLDRASLKNQIANAQLPFFRGSWIADYADPENYLALFYSKNKSPNGPNYTHFENKEFDTLYELCRKESNDSIRESYYLKMNSIISNESPVFPLYYDEVTLFQRKNVEGLRTNALNRPDLRKVKINKLNKN